MATKHIEVNLSGMHCQSCVERVKAALQTCPGLARIDVEVGRVRAAFESEQCTARQVVQAVESAGPFRATAFHVE